MCLKVYKIHENIPKDFYCYKVVYNFKSDGFYQSLYFDYKYYLEDFGKTLVAGRVVDRNLPSMLTDEVFHTYCMNTSIKRLFEPELKEQRSTILCKFPKSSTVYFNKYQTEAASHSMIVLGELDTSKLDTYVKPCSYYFEGIIKYASENITVYTKLNRISTPYLASPIEYIMASLKCATWGIYSGGILVSYNKSEEYPDEVIIPKGSCIILNEKIGIVNNVMISRVYNKLYSNNFKDILISLVFVV